MKNILLGCVILSCVCSSNALLASVALVDDESIIQLTPNENSNKTALPLPEFARKRERVSNNTEEVLLVATDETPPITRKPRVKHEIPQNQVGVRAKRNLGF